MPIYDYLCANCGQTTEVIHGIDAPGPRFCPACGAEGTLRKAFVTPTVHFKGSGWAKKDRSSSSGTRAKSGAGSSGDAAEGGTKSGPASPTSGGDSTSGGESATASKSSSSSAGED
jgi:putative FmdB family regulatory protein